MRCLLLALLLVPFNLGCEQHGPRTYPVSGTVRFDDKPVSEGDIVFVPTNSSLAPDAGKISDGKFTARAKEGTCRVEITALDINSDTPVVMGSPVAENYIPERYNIESELTARVSSSEKNNYEFELTSESSP